MPSISTLAIQTPFREPCASDRCCMPFSLSKQCLPSINWPLLICHSSVLVLCTLPCLPSIPQYGLWPAVLWQIYNTRMRPPLTLADIYASIMSSQFSTEVPSVTFKSTSIHPKTDPFHHGVRAIIDCTGTWIYSACATWVLQQFHWATGACPDFPSFSKQDNPYDTSN